jgi:16S rRNA (cytosine967-C5)-methyltransferase
LLAAVGPRVLDACAAPGGKSTLMADVLGDAGSVIAIERSADRLRSMRRLVGRWGAGNVVFVRGDVAAPPLRGSFDGVLLDAPCSGLGTLARHPDLRWRSHPEDLTRHAERQRILLEALSPHVRPGGRLVFAVCSLEPEETLEVVTPFLARHGEFRPAALPAWCELFRDGDFAATRPERDGSDGFFAAALDRAE